MSVWGGVYFMNGVSPVMEHMIFFHDYSMAVMLVVMVFVGYVLLGGGSEYSLCMLEGQGLESVWTVLPMFFLLMIVFPSIRLLYLMEEVGETELSISAMGHQWYWSYEYSDIGVSVYDSYMVKEGGLFRLLEVDNSLVIPCMSEVRMLVTSMDVIHSWTVPALGVSVDAIPGRLNQLSYFFKRVGLYVGQCSEICGANHSFMPISLIVVPRGDFLLCWA